MWFFREDFGSFLSFGRTEFASHKLKRSLLKIDQMLNWPADNVIHLFCYLCKNLCHSSSGAAIDHLLSSRSTSIIPTPELSIMAYSFFFRAVPSRVSPISLVKDPYFALNQIIRNKLPRGNEVSVFFTRRLWFTAKTKISRAIFESFAADIAMMCKDNYSADESEGFANKLRRNCGFAFCPFAH